MTYPIGTPGTPWTDEDKALWRSKQVIKRSYQSEVVSKFESAPTDFNQFIYGTLHYDQASFPLYVFTSPDLDTSKPIVLITGGVHGYETSGVHGAIEFLNRCAETYLETFHFVIAPCLSPWGYETINRWNPMTIDPNRSFYANTPSAEAHHLMQYLSAQDIEIFAHFDLHETTDTDDSEFRPALAAKNGTEFSDWGIPDGFYTVADTHKPQLAFQKAIIESVKKVTHIAPPDSHGKIIGADVVSEGVITYDKKALFLCGGMTAAKFVTTTEVYPDSAKTTPDECVDAQVAAIVGGLDYIASTF